MHNACMHACMSKNLEFSCYLKGAVESILVSEKLIVVSDAV